MNHYERLKVTQDAPPEVIRAAYRALANRLHPDRNGGVGGPDDATHEQMAALNAAYEILIDPMLRRDYDATLAPIRVTAARPLGEGGATPGAADDSGMSSLGERSLERPWEAQVPLSSRPAWAPGPKHILAGAVLGAALLVLVGAALWRMNEEVQPLDRALSAQAVAAPFFHGGPSGFAPQAQMQQGRYAPRARGGGGGCAASERRTRRVSRRAVRARQGLRIRRERRRAAACSLCHEGRRAVHAR